MKRLLLSRSIHFVDCEVPTDGCNIISSTFFPISMVFSATPRFFSIPPRVSFSISISAETSKARIPLLQIQATYSRCCGCVLELSMIPALTYWIEYARFEHESMSPTLSGDGLTDLISNNFILN